MKQLPIMLYRFLIYPLGLGLVTLLVAPVILANTLHLYNWNNYLPQPVIKRFEAKFHCTLVEDYYGDNEEMLAKLVAGAKGYDIVVPTTYAVQALIQQGKIIPLNKRQLPNFHHLDKNYLNNRFDPNNRFSVPYAFTITLLGYNSTQLKALSLERYVNSWALLFDPVLLKKIKGRVTVLNSHRELIAAALLYLGKNPNSTNPKDWQAASRVIIQAKPYWAAFNNQGYLKELAVGNIWVAMGYSSDFYQAKRYTQGLKKTFQIDFTLQKEGNILAMDNLVILSHAKHPTLAHQFINFMLDGENAAALTNQIGLGNPNRAALPYIQSNIAHNRAILPSPTQIQHLHQLDELNAAQRRQLNRIWSIIKLR